VVPVPTSGLYLVVQKSDVERAAAALAPLLETEASKAAAAHFDPEKGYARCPACQTELPDGALECPECGLAVGGFKPAACDHCGAGREAEEGACTSCGR
jgi:hypothetical protein